MSGEGWNYWRGVQGLERIEGWRKFGEGMVEGGSGGRGVLDWIVEEMDRTEGKRVGLGRIGGGLVWRLKILW